MMREASTFMSETLNDVLSIQKIEEGKLELSFEPFLISNLLRYVLIHAFVVYKHTAFTFSSTLCSTNVTHIPLLHFTFIHVLPVLHYITGQSD